MALPDHLIKAALLGTAKQPFSSESVLSDSSAVSLKDETPEAQLLLSAATLNLRQRAGYTAEQSHLSLTDASPSETLTVCSDQAMRHLRLMLKGVHTYALKEWLITAIKARRRVQTDVIPNLLLLGLKRKDLRPYLLPVLGQRGMWLSLEIINQNWKWVYDTPEYPIEDVIAFDRHYERDVIEELREKPFEPQFNQMFSWFKSQLVWSEELTDVMLSTIETTTPPKWNGVWWRAQVLRTLTNYIYFFPLHQEKEIQQRLKTMITDQTPIPDVFETFDIIYAFRRHMIEAIRKED